MKEHLLTNCEKEFIGKGIQEGLRLDGRSPDEFRNVQISFGTEFGSVYCCLGETRVLASISCQVTQPKSVRPQEGLLFINVEVGPMASPHFESGRPSDAGVQLNRILERVLKDSRCVDLESLCIVAEEKVWSIRIDVNILNYEGNAVDCASVACLAALAHFRRPDVTSTGNGEIIVHTAAEKALIPMVILHFPVCVSFGIFHNGKLAIADPSKLEERVSEANIVFGINSYKELCGLHLGGTTLTNPQLLLRCAEKGTKRARKLVDLIKETLAKDADQRALGEKPSFANAIYLDTAASVHEAKLPIKLKNFRLTEQQNVESMQTEDLIEDSKIKVIEASSSSILMPQPKSNKWIPQNSSSSSSSIDDEDVLIVDAKNAVSAAPISLDSEEDETESLHNV